MIIRYFLNSLNTDTTLQTMMTRQDESQWSSVIVLKAGAPHLSTFCIFLQIFLPTKVNM